MTHVTRPGSGPGYKPAPQPNTTYSGPDVPTAYDPNWQYFTNLKRDQIAWFQAQPEWQNFITYVSLSPTTATVATPVAVVNGALQAAGQTPVPPGIVSIKL